MVFDRRLGKVFKKSSFDYHNSRKGYPNQLFLDIVKISGINKKSEVLDIGCGSGLSTLPITKKGYSITGIDPSKELIKIARKNAIKGRPEYILAAFEKYKFKENYFDLIISGQAFHWLDEKVAYKKCFNILKKNGYLAIFGKFNDYKKSIFLQELREIYMKHCKYYPQGLYHDDYASHYVKEIEKTSLFTKIISKQYRHYLKYSLKDYRTNILSNSWMIKLDNSKKKEVLRKIDNLLAQFKWPMKVPFGAALIMAKKR